VDYAIKTLSQLRPILQGFRKAAGLTQAAMAAHLGVTQQTYAQLEANPAAVSVERLFKVLRVLQVDLKFTQGGSPQSVAVEDAAPAPHRSPSRRAGSGKPATETPAPAKGNAKRAARVPLEPGTSAQKQARAQAPAQRAQTASPGESSDRAAAQASGTGAKAVKSAKATRAASTSKKREDW
jgi:HTH-type transcriptional regulator/antitoxin HipB